MAVLNRLRALPAQVLSVARHPLNKGHGASALCRWLSWQVGSRLVPGPVLVPFVNDTRLVASPGEAGATGNIFYGLAEFEEMAFALHLLRPDDLFIDVGANIGSYSILAAGAVGCKAIAFEPVPQTAQRLELNILVNNLSDRVEIHACGLADAPGDLPFCIDSDTVNRVVIGGKGGTLLPVDTLDRVLAGRIPRLIKIDVEGFEGQVLKGAIETLRSRKFSALIIETIGAGEEHGVTTTAIVGMLAELGYQRVTYLPNERRLLPLSNGHKRSNNTIFVQDIAAAQQRVSTAPQFRVGWQDL